MKHQYFKQVLHLKFKHWTTIFSKDADFKSIESFYNELRSKGVDFPLYDPENTATDLNNFTTTVINKFFFYLIS